MADDRAAVDSTPPLIARVAGLPASWIESFGGEALSCALRDLELAGRELAEVRGQLVERLHALASTVPPALRRFLLAVKRDGYNGRTLLPHRAAAQWQDLAALTAPLADRVTALEEHARAAAGELDRCYEATLQRELLHLRNLLGNQSFRRGLALSSSALAVHLSRLETTPLDGYGRRERRAAQSLLRYGSRAALKLSPFSTLTRVSVARLVGDPSSGAAVRLLGRCAEWRERSLVRLRRYVVHELAQVLLHCPAIRDAVPWRLNRSLNELEPGRYLLLKPTAWKLAAGVPRLRFVAASLHEMTLSRALVAWLAARLSPGAGRRELAASIGEVLGRAGDPLAGEALVERLIQRGLIVPWPPWSAEDLRLESRLAECLPSFSAAELAPVAESLSRIAELEDGLCAAADPAGSALEIERRLDAAWVAAVAAAGLPGGTERHRRKTDELYEDVLLLGEPPAEGVVEVRGSALAEALASLAPWFRLIDLHSPRCELLHTFAALARRRWPERPDVGALELFREVQPLWPEGRALLASPPSAFGESSGFNPLGLSEIAELDRWRRFAGSELPRRLRDEGEASRLSSRDVEAVLAPAPAGLSSPLGCCAFLQPADATGELWVLNRLFEGTGRYASRFTPVMPEGLRRRVTRHLISRSRLQLGGQEVELLDLISSQGDTLNVHALQTRRVLSLPEESLSLAPERTVEVSELRVRIAPESPLPYLTDAAGRRLLPVYLGAAALVYTPPLITFLALFGPGELPALRPHRPRRQVGGVEELARVLLDRVVVSRRRWIVPPAALAELGDLASARGFAALDRWRRAHGIPDRVFAIEKVRFGSQVEVYKPQYLDLTSPSFCALLGVMARAGDAALTVEEMLPRPAAFPRDAGGESWAVEVQADTFALSLEES